MSVMFFVVFLLRAVTPVLGFGTGAPSSVCGSMAPEHTRISPQTSKAPYTIEFNSINSTFQTGQPIKVIIKGPEYAGVLLEARSGSSTEALGNWETPPTNTKFLRCSANNQGAITHANTNMKNNLTEYTWVPPATATKIYFIATVAQSRETYWLNVQSAALTRVGPVGSGLGVVPRTASTPVLLLLTLMASTLSQS